MYIISYELFAGFNIADVYGRDLEWGVTTVTILLLICIKVDITICCK